MARRARLAAKPSKVRPQKLLPTGILPPMAAIKRVAKGTAKAKRR
jgi:hypothetical protein